MFTVSGWIVAVGAKPGPKVTTCCSLPPPKCRSEAVCTSLIGAWLLDVYVEISCWLRSEKYGSLCRCRSSVRQMPAYAITDEPLPGSTDVAGLAEGEMADVVVRGADDLADHEARPRRARAAGDLSLREAGRGATGTV